MLYSVFGSFVLDVVPVPVCIFAYMLSKKASILK